MSIRDVAQQVDSAGSTYAYYESPRFKKDVIPVSMARRLAELWAPRGVDSGQVMALAGMTSGEQLTRSAGLAQPEAVPYQAEPGDAAIIQALAPDARRADLWEMRSRALNLAGILPGDIMIVDLAPFIAAADDIVCAQRYRPGGEAETVFRIFDPPYLVAVSNDTDFRKPLLIDDHVSIMGRVLASFRRHRTVRAAAE